MKKEIGISLDMRMTGELLNYMIRKRGYTVSEIQEELSLSCPQPIYRWIRGQTMPSIDNLYKLSKILNVHMDELVIPSRDEAWLVRWNQNLCVGRHLKAYHKRYLKGKGIS